ncbi:MAG: glycoside hydrolase family 2 TIM barrel-domain containing protein [Bacteroidota bacterium]
MPPSPSYPTLPLDWQLAHSETPNAQPTEWVPAQVPGAVQLDWAKHAGYDDWYKADNWQDYRWMEDRYWIYQTEFSPPELGPDQALIFHCKGIDYAFSVWLNGERIHLQEGMFTPFELNLTPHLLPTNTLTIKVLPAPKLHDFPEDRTQAAQSTKPAVSYVWDWHPRLIPLGIWEETQLEIRPKIHLKAVETFYQMKDDLKQAQVWVSPQLSEEGNCRYRWTLLSPTGESVATKTGTCHDLELNPIAEEVTIDQLWWPHDHGTPALYLSKFEILGEDDSVLDAREKRVGFRKVRMVMNGGAWVEPINFPKSRSVAPITLEINGRRIFGKGTNWVNPEVFPGLITRERYEEQLILAKAANFNLLRQWGGSIINKESFYELCDEMGLMVWQEFPLSCNDYVGSDRYLQVLEQEATSIITRLRQHASVVMWCGGNELFNNWSGMTDQSLALRLLNSLTYQLDREHPFIPTAPVMGMGHGNYVFRDWDNGEEVFQSMPKAECTAYTEFGMPGPSPVEVIRSFMPEDQLFPPAPGTVWETHHAYNAWQGNTWLMEDTLEDYFGKPESLEQMVQNGQWLQAEGYKCIFEEARRQKPYCSMALNWCYNEPWPAAANNSLICWPNVPKPAFYAVGNACRPTMLSARIPKFHWKGGELFSAEVWLLNDRYEQYDSIEVWVLLRVNGKEIELLKWNTPAIQPNENLAGPTAKFLLPNWEIDRIELAIVAPHLGEWDSSYLLRYDPTLDQSEGGTRTLNL